MQASLWAPDSAERLDFIRAKHYLHPSRSKLARFPQERSEDCLTWNVFDTIRRSGRLGHALAWFADLAEPGKASIQFWGHDPDDDKALESMRDFLLTDAGERAGGLSEFDVILRSPRDVVFIEAKFGSENPNQDMHRRWGDYAAITTQAGVPVFDARPEVLAQGGAYQLARNWACGARWASKQGPPAPRFHLVNLVREGDAADIEETFGSLVNPAVGRFVRRTWEGLAQAVCPDLIPKLRGTTEYFEPAFPTLDQNNDQ